MKQRAFRIKKNFTLGWFVFMWSGLLLTGCPGAGSESFHFGDQASNHFRSNHHKDQPTTRTGESEFELNLRTLINDYRRNNGLEALAYDPRLHDLAREHSTEMARGNTLSHDGFNDRFERSGYNLAVENIAFNYRTPQALLEGWRNSPGHNTNMLQPGISHAGISRVGTYLTFFACGN